ncbi:hypothetical protein jhhlp_005331 [Lomentospora prolificans]|uniref:C2H2-type domain-containing protein n=1 Tax=Lomentospora prolificans TaxID=41688 RepID=A0A2N3N7L7_9PEZI|nr:hypothetical protein jhhlp_005331 [Lomentospora prolificans]
MTETREYYLCPQCSKRYKRREHMQRHWASHNSARPHRCNQCGRAFQRLDVLKRHTRTCEARALGLIAPATRRRACDSCVRQKKACSAGQPCQNCQRLSIDCNYSFVANREGRRQSVSRESNSADSDSNEARTPSLADEMFSGVGEGATAEEINAIVLAADPFESTLWDSPEPTTAWMDYLNVMPGLPQLDPFPQRLRTPQSEHEGQMVPRRKEKSRYSFHFLDNFTKRTGLIDSFECCTPEFREQTLAYFLQQQAAINSMYRHAAPPSASHLVNLGNNLGMPLSSEASPLPGANVPMVQNPWLHDPLMIKIHQIIVHAKEVIMIKPRNSVVNVEWSPLLERKCLEFFSPDNVRKCLAFYWAVWHPNVNLIHKPTFDPAAANPPLLAAMTVLGASVSPCSTDQDDAKLWFNCVEEMVFTDDDLCSEPLYTLDTGVPIPATQKRKLQALQAAFIVCLFQNWEGTDASKRRIRRYRFGTVVSVARDIGLPMARHMDIRRPIGYEFQWKTFVVKEELIRIFLWIFLLDHAFVTFNNLPPRMVIKEMKIHLARPEACFQAETAEECLEELQKWTAQSAILPVLTLSEAVEMVCKGAMPEGMHETLAHLGALNLFAMISAVHSLVFQHQNSFSQDGHLAAIRHALNNWKPVWDIYMTTHATSPPHNMLAGVVLTPENAWRRIGFCRHAHDYWLLASVIIDKLTSPVCDMTVNPASSPESDTGQSPPRENTTILTQYDQTSMQQVNELIADFQKIQIFNKPDDA